MDVLETSAVEAGVASVDTAFATTVECEHGSFILQSLTITIQAIVPSECAEEFVESDRDAEHAHNSAKHISSVSVGFK